MKKIATIGTLAGLVIMVFMVSLSVSAPAPPPVIDPTPPAPPDPPIEPIPSPDPSPPKYDATGTWDVSLREGWTDCPGPSVIDQDVSAEISQTGNVFSIAFGGDLPENGTVSGSKYQLSRSSMGSTLSFVWDLISTSVGNGYIHFIRLEGQNELSCVATSRLHLIKQGACQPTDTLMCLHESRFSATVFWEDKHGNTGDGNAVPTTDDSGLFWFFSPNNMELLIKVLDGCGINNRYWVFFAATTDQKFNLTVTDLKTGEVVEYTNPLGNAADAVTDTDAFATCP